MIYELRVAVAVKSWESAGFVIKQPSTIELEKGWRVGGLQPLDLLPEVMLPF